MGVSGCFLEALKRMYERIRMRVKLQGRLGDAFDTKWGTKQGSSLSPLLFGGLIEQLCNMISQRVPGAGPWLGNMRVPHILYADDVVLLVESPDHMQQLLDVLDLFCTLFGMRVNMSKTKGVVFHANAGPRSSTIRRCNWSFQGQAIEIAHDYTYLGVVFDEKNGCVAGAEARAVAGRKAMYALLGRTRALHLNQSDLLCRLFDQLIEPGLSYGCQVWGPALADKVLSPATWQSQSSQADTQRPPHRFDHVLNRKFVPAEAVHLDYLRHIGGLPSCSQRWITLAEFDRKPLVVRWLALAARLWERLSCMRSRHRTYHNMLQLGLGDEPMPEGSALTVTVFEESIQMFVDDPTSSCWAAQFLRCMRQLGVVDDLSAYSTVDGWLEADVTEAAVKVACDQMIESWWVQAGANQPDPSVAGSDDVWCSTYRQWVQGPQPGAPHLKQFLSHSVKQSLIRLRVGCYPLRVATGRNEGADRRGIPRSSRTCRVCNEPGSVEDLRHFLLQCSAYAAIRQRWHEVFGTHQCTKAVLGQRNQSGVAAAIWHMVQHRSNCLLDD